MPPVGKVPYVSWGRNKRMAFKEAEEEEGGPWLNLWLGNLSPETVDEDLMAAFAKFGAMDSVTSYFPRPYAFVYFRTIEDAKAAKQALQGIVIRGRPIRIQFARPAKPGKTLWVGGVNQSVTKAQLENSFAKFGVIEEFKFLRHRGSAFICFHRIEDAISAQKSMNWNHLGGSEIRVDFQRLPLFRRDWDAERDHRGSKNVILTDQLLPSDEMKHLLDSSPHLGIRRHLPQGKRKNEQPSNVLWVGYPPELQIDEELLHNSMILFGEIEKIQSIPSRNYCYVEFRSVDEARRAKEGLQGRLLGDSRIQILFANSELIPGGENAPLSAPEFFLNEPPMSPVELFGPVHPMASNRFHGHLAPNVIPRAHMSIRPFAPGFDPHLGGSDFHEFGGVIHGFPDSIINNPMASNLKRLSPPAPSVITPGLVVHAPLMPSQAGRDDLDVREPKRSRFDGFFPSSDAHFPGRIVDADDMPDFSGLPHSDRNLLTRNLQQTPDIRGHDPSRASPGIDFCWRGIIAKGGTPVCRARCLPIGNGIEAPFPEIVNCSARTGLDMLTTHYSEAVGFDMVFFLPDSEEDFASYTEFLRYLGQRDRAGVAKFDDGTTMFLVPPSDFLTKVLEYSGPERLYGVVLKLPQQTTATGQQLQPIMPATDAIDTQPGMGSQKSYGFIPQNQDQTSKVDYGNSSHERSIPHAVAERPMLVHSEEPHPIPAVAQNHLKSHETKSQPEVSLTPELIATLASLIPTNPHPSAVMPSQMPSSSALIPAFSAHPVNDNSMLMQAWGHEGRTSFSGTSVEQMYNPMQNLPRPGHPYSNQVPLVSQFSNYTNSTNGLDNSFQPSMVGMPSIQDASLHIQQVPGVVGTVGNDTVSSQVGQYQVLQNSQATDVAGIYGLALHQQIMPATPASTFNGSVLQVPAEPTVMNADHPGQTQQHLQAFIPGSGQGNLEGDADKDQRYHSTLQFAASLLLQIQQQQQAKALAALGFGNQQ
ncbi:flowering time control protein FPA [Phalaenopsis equestris]|uniref:flowering time control protein FPA n=1 Tax=Phalaenopsis equestris TaxID=78828 RepID=UPI0009E3ED35|nr:flowering time control protein FPA [Phalaenopsis equestris]XP_020599711.1 flowering time control protein FPA [Phalaenopsis equestris]